MTHSPGARFRTYSLLGLFVFLRPLGNLSLAWGTKHFPQVLSLNPVVYLRAMVDPFVALGIAMLILALLTLMLSALPVSGQDKSKEAILKRFHDEFVRY